MKKKPYASLVLYLHNKGTLAYLQNPKSVHLERFDGWSKDYPGPERLSGKKKIENAILKRWYQEGTRQCCALFPFTLSLEEKRDLSWSALFLTNHY